MFACCILGHLSTLHVLTFNRDRLMSQAVYAPGRLGYGESFLSLSDYLEW